MAPQIPWISVKKWDGLDSSCSRAQMMHLKGRDHAAKYAKWAIGPASKVAGVAAAVASLGMYIPKRYYLHMVCSDSQTYEALQALLGDLDLGYIDQLKSDWQTFCCARLRSLLKAIQKQLGSDIEVAELVITKGHADHVVLAVKRAGQLFENSDVLSNVAFYAGQKKGELEWVEWLSLVVGQMPG